MATYDETRLDGADPAYAPGLKQEGRLWKWVAAPRYRKAGYKDHRRNLPGIVNDGRDLERAVMCRDFTREMLRWYQDGDLNPICPGTVAWLVQRFLTDETSRYHDIRTNSQEVYRQDCLYWDKAMGKVQIAALDAVEVKKIINAMKAKGRSASFMRRKIGTLGRLARHGQATFRRGHGKEECADLADVLKGVRLTSPLPRTIAPTREQIMAVVAKADAGGHPEFALGLLLQWWLALRAMDVRGDWIPAQGQGGIKRGDKLWANGLTWDHVAPDCGTITKVISKTQGSNQRPKVFPLTGIPDVQHRLVAMPNKVGPVIVNPATGLPYDAEGWRKLWRRFADEAGIPANVQVRDARAGALTEASRLGVDEATRMKVAGHSTAEMARAYARDEAEAIAQVIDLRTKAKR